jgi:hypothetical protein
VHTEFWWGNLGERDNLEDLGIDGRIILKWVFIKWNGDYFVCTFSVAYIRCFFTAVCMSVIGVVR